MSPCTDPKGQTRSFQANMHEIFQNITFVSTRTQFSYLKNAKSPRPQRSTTVLKVKGQWPVNDHEHHESPWKTLCYVLQYSHDVQNKVRGLPIRELSLRHFQDFLIHQKMRKYNLVPMLGYACETLLYGQA